MKLLIAEDDLTSRLVLTTAASKWGYAPIAVEDGEAAWQVMQEDESPLLLLLDWEMPKLNGLELCKRLRQQKSDQPLYIILLTSRSETNDIVTGLETGANDYIAKPFDHAELKARLDVGKRMIMLQTNLAKAMSRLRLTSSVFTHTLEGILIADSKGCILEVNEAFSRITGYSYDEVIGKNPSILASGHQDKNFYIDMWNEIGNKGQWSGEIWNRRKNGEVYAEMLSISAVHNEKNIIKHYVAIFSDITIQKDNQQQLEYIAHHDALTELPNRLLFIDRLEQSIIQARRRRNCFALAYLDLDGFKEVNDTHGHEVGDKLLITIASRMKQLVRESDTVARIGGDEFVVIISDLNDCKDSLPPIKKLLLSVVEPIKVDELKLQVTASIGISYYVDADETDAKQLLDQADKAMYQAKQAGKNCYSIFSAE